jgi:hypothetical protein
MLRNTPVQRLEGGNPTTALSSGRLVTRQGEISITFRPQCKDDETANLTTNYGKKMVKQKRKKQIIKYASFSVRGIAHKEEKPDYVLNKK